MSTPEHVRRDLMNLVSKRMGVVFQQAMQLLDESERPFFMLAFTVEHVFALVNGVCEEDFPIFAALTMPEKIVVICELMTNAVPKEELFRSAAKGKTQLQSDTKAAVAEIARTIQFRGER